MANRRAEVQPLTGKPPFATDIPDEAYQQPVTQMRRRPELIQPATFENRNSEYGAFDHYFDEKETKAPVNRNSGIGDVGMGFMAGDISDDDESDDGRSRLPPSKQPVSNNADQRSQPTTANKPSPLLAASTPMLRQQRPPAAGGSPPGPPPPPNALRPGPAQYPPPAPPYQSVGPMRGGPPPPPQQFPSNQLPPPAARNVRPTPLNVAQPTPIPARPAPAFISPSSPAPRSPHLLNAPPSPIVPLFAARPQSETTNRPGAKSRGTSEEALLLKSDSTTGDDFWKRFSMVVKKENSKPPEKRKSPWLRSYENGRHRLSAWVWIVSVLLLVCIFGGIGVGWYFTHNKSNIPPTAIGGSADENSLSDAVAPTGSTSSLVATATSSHKPSKTHQSRSDYHRRHRRRALS